MFALFIVCLMIAAVLIVVGKAMEPQGDSSKAAAKKLLHLAGYGCAALGVLFFILACAYVVNPGEVGVEVLFGKVMKYSESGLRMKAPIADVIRFDVKTHRENFKSEGMSKDMQVVTIESAVNFRIDFTRISDLYTKVGRDYMQKIVEPAIHQAVKAASAKFNVEEITVNRDGLKRFIEDEQQAEQAKQQVILEAQAEGEKQRLLRANTSPEVIQLKMIEKWDGHYPTVVAGSGSGMILQLNPTK